MVGAELDFVVLWREGEGDGHDACVVDEDVEAGGLGLERLCGLGDGCEGGEVEREIGDFGIGDFFFDDGNSGFGLRFGSSSKENVCCIMFGELENRLFT